jgi:hypothetical protein
VTTKPLELRHEIAAFAQEMEAALRRHDAERGERGWANSTRTWLLASLVEHVVKLRASIFSGGDYMRDAADVANFAMMLADLNNPGERRRPTREDTIYAGLEIAEVAQEYLRKVMRQRSEAVEVQS